MGRLSGAKRWDIFISHASEDKDSFVRPLVQALVTKKVRVWFDEASLKLGDSLLRKSNEGLANSHHGLVILSPAFFAKSWPGFELDGVMALATSGSQVILPVLHELTHKQLLSLFPVGAGLVYVSSRRRAICCLQGASSDHGTRRCGRSPRLSSSEAY